MVGFLRRKKVSEQQASSLDDEYHHASSDGHVDEYRRKKHKRSKHRRDGRRKHKFRCQKQISHQSIASKQRPNQDITLAYRHAHTAPTGLLKSDERVQMGAAQENLQQQQHVPIYLQQSRPTKAVYNYCNLMPKCTLRQSLSANQEALDNSQQQPLSVNTNESFHLSSSASVLPVQASNKTQKSDNNDECPVSHVPDESLRRDTLLKCIAGILTFLDFFSKPPIEANKLVEDGGSSKRASEQKQLDKVCKFISLTVHESLNKSDELFKRINYIDRLLPAHLSSDRNAESCRFDDVHCADQSRILLLGSCNLHQQSDFIHANRVPIDKKREFILTQLPLRRTVKQFWQLVWQEKAEVVLVILTKHEWKHYGETIQLVPKSGSLQLPGGFLVTFNQEMEITKNVSMKELHLSVHGYQKKVFWIQYTDWLHDLAPKSSDELWQIHHLLRKFNGPVICMSMSGIGRAATYTAIEMLYHQLQNPNVAEVLIEETVQKLRNYRMLAIQSSKQMTFIQLAILDYLLSHKKVKAVVNQEIQNLYGLLKSSKYKQIATSDQEELFPEELLFDPKTSGLM